MTRYYLFDSEQDASFEEGLDHLESRKAIGASNKIVGGPLPSFQHQFQAVHDHKGNDHPRVGEAGHHRTR
jgi:hypothetical protein